MTRYFLTLLAFFLLSVAGAFFAYVAVIPVVLATVILLGLVLMFGLGIYVGKDPASSGSPSSLG